MKYLQRIQVVLSSIVTWAAIVSSLATLVISNPDRFPEGAVGVATLVVAGATALGTVVAAIRRVTPVDPSERGLLPKG
jgi:hypothetical protein